MNPHRITLLGCPAEELRVAADVLAEALSALVDGARLATRFAVEGQSVRQGPKPAWLDAACSIDVTGLEPGSVRIDVEAPTLAVADPQRFGDGGQRPLFEQGGPSIGGRTAVDLFGQVLAGIVEGPSDEIAADRGLLDACSRFARLSAGGLSGVRIEGIAGRNEPLIVTEAHVARIELLRDETPPSRATRVSGILDTISASRAGVTLQLADGRAIPARLDEPDADTLRELFGRAVVVSGMAHYRPSGRLLMVEVESIAEARPADALFASMPEPHGRPPVVAEQAQDATSGVGAFFGAWPGDESDAELLDALGALR
jgi:hypothetical protein